MDHSEVLSSLERQLRDYDKIIFVEPRLTNMACGAPDIFSIKKSFSKPDPHVYEVKATQADLLTDLRANKWEKYLPLCERLTFAVHHSIDWKTHLKPMNNVGIMVLNEKGKWSTRRAAKRHGFRVEMDEALCFSLIFGRMTDNQRDARGGRYLRLLREKEALLSDELHELRKTSNKKLEGLVFKLNRQEHDLECREDRLEKDLKNMVKVAETRALKRVGKLFQINWFSGKEESIVNRYFRDLIQNAAQIASNKIDAKLKEIIEEKQS